MNNQDLCNSAISACLISTPIWSELIQTFSLIAQLISVSAGAIIGLITLWRMIGPTVKVKVKMVPHLEEKKDNDNSG